MEKPIIATTLSELFIKSNAWDNAHLLWFEKAAEMLKDDSIKKWINKPDYFKGVEEVMQRLYPNLSDEQRTVKARETYFDSVLKSIGENSEYVNKEIVGYFTSLKDKYRLALITTNTRPALKKILELTNLVDLFDLIETSDPKEKDNKKVVFERFIEENGKPLIYIGGRRKESYDYCKDNGIPCIFVNLEGDEDIEGLRCVHNLNEIKQVIEEL
ncbi:MAG: HAD hydrolase-like protein [archaeon]